MREWRKTHRPSPEQQYRGRARAYLNVYVRRGKVVRRPCLVCGAEQAEGHHHNGYADPLDVTWLCKAHHREAHRST